MALLAFAPFGQALGADPLHLTTGMAAPWTNETDSGFHQKLIREVFVRARQSARVSVNPASSRALSLANDGVTDGVVGRVAGLEEEYPNLVRVPEVMFYNDFVACGLAAEPAPLSWDGLRPKAVAHIIGWQVFEHNLPKVRELTQVKDGPQLLALLKAGRTEVILYERWQALYQAKMAEVSLVIHDPPLARVPMFFYLHQRHAALAAPLAEALRSMKADGTYEAIARHSFGGLGSSVTTLK